MAFIFDSRKQFVVIKSHQLTQL